jgi:hypothetical protein
MPDDDSVHDPRVHQQKRPAQTVPRMLLASVIDALDSAAWRTAGGILDI